MALYVLTKKVLGPDTVDAVLALAETYIETLDSTDNPIYFSQFIKDGDDWGRIIILHKT